MLALLRRLQSLLFKYSCLLALKLQSLRTACKACFHRDIILIDKPYQQQKILLIALYEKGLLRPDIQRLLRMAKDRGYFIFGINSAKIQDITALSEIFDLYIEKFNFGRDFASYKSGFLELFQRKYHLTCPRLLMLNDSVFYESTRVPAFLETLMNSDLEVLGATENHQLKHHLGSFCIAYSNQVLKHPRFIKFWKQYKNTDVRPSVIDNGEKKLTQILKGVVSHPASLRALYDANHLSEELNSNSKLLNLAFQLTSRSGLHLRLSARDTWQIFMDQYYFVGSKFEYEAQSLHDINSFITFFKKKAQIDDPDLESKAKLFVLSRITHAFTNNSQIHTNGVLLLHLGLPLVKLDGFFRGAFSLENVHEICQLLNEDEAKELKHLLLTRPYGSEVFRSKERFMFEHGFI